MKEKNTLPPGAPKTADEPAIVKDTVNVTEGSIEKNIEGIKNPLGVFGVVENILQSIDAYFFIADPDDGSLLFMNDKMKDYYSIQKDISGLKCWEVMFPGGRGICADCPRHQIVPGKVYEWENHDSATGKHYLMNDRYIEWFDKKKVHLQFSTDITGHKLAALELGRRLEQQTLMTSISRSFLSDENFNISTERALRMIGEFIDATQILIYKLEDDDVTFTCQNEWLNPKLGLNTRIGSQIKLQEPTLPAMSSLMTHKRLCLHSNDPATREAMEPYMLNSQNYNYIIAPVFVRGKMDAVINFSIDGARTWDKSEIDLAILISSILSGVFEKSDMESQSSIVENSPNLIIYFSPDGTVEYANPAATAFTGYTNAEFISGGLGVIFDEQTVRDIKEQYIPDTMRNGMSYFEVGMVSKSDIKMTMAFTSFTAPVRESRFGVHIGMIGNDITEARWLESELITAKDLAEQGSRAKSEFMSRMSHEMRTHMNIIIGMTQIAQISDDPKEKIRCLAEIGKASQMLLQLINDVLDTSSMENGTFKLADSVFSFKEMLKGILREMGASLKEKRQLFDFEVDPSMPAWLAGDEKRLAQVIMNLLTNAIKFTHEHGEINLAARVIGEENEMLTLQIEVSDNGIGIPLEQQSMLFDIFEQVDGSSTRKHSGIGLGLAISKYIVEQMGGRIWAESEPGKGSKFTFTCKIRKSDG